MLVQSTKNYATKQLKMIVYGPPGVGKTTLASTTKEPTLVVSMEGGLLSLSDFDVDFIDCTVDEKNETIDKAARLDKLKEVYTWLQSDNQKEKYKWIVLDSLTEMGQNIIDVQNALFPDRKDGFVMWGEIAKAMRTLVKEWRDLPGYNVVFTALTEVDKDELGARFQNISVPGKFAQQLPAYFDEVFYYHMYKTEDGLDKRVLVTQPTDKAIAKDRSGKLDLMMEPNLSDIANRIRQTQKVVSATSENSEALFN